MMKVLYFFIIAPLLLSDVRDFDPAGPPPEKTMEWTTAWLGNTMIPKVTLEGVTIQEAIDFFHLQYSAGYRVEIECPKTKENKGKKITFHGEKLTYIEVIGGMADAAGMNIMIAPGKVYLIPRNSD